MVSAPDMYEYVGPDGDVVESTEHDFAVRLKGLGYVRAPQRDEDEDNVQQRDAFVGESVEVVSVEAEDEAQVEAQEQAQQAPVEPVQAVPQPVQGQQRRR